MDENINRGPVSILSLLLNRKSISGCSKSWFVSHTVGKIIFTERGEHLLVSVSFMICCPLELEVLDKMIITIVLPYPNQKQNGTFTFQS